MSDPTNEPTNGADAEAVPSPAVDLPANPGLQRLIIAAAKLRDAMAGFEPDFTPGEADAAGAFTEDALDEHAARDTGDAWTRFLAAMLPRKRT